MKAIRYKINGRTRLANPLKIGCGDYDCLHAFADHRKIANRPGLGVCWVDGCGCVKYKSPTLKTADDVIDWLVYPITELGLLKVKS